MSESHGTIEAHGATFDADGTKRESESMVERVARAMRQRAKEPLANLNSLELVLVGSLGDAWPYLARAAIYVLREPTGAMVKAGYRDDSEYANDEDTADQWRRMIDEALK